MSLDLGFDFCSANMNLRIERNLFDKDSIYTIFTQNQIRLNTVLSQKFENKYWISISANIEAFYLNIKSGNTKELDLTKYELEKELLSQFIKFSKEHSLMNEDINSEISALYNSLVDNITSLKATNFDEKLIAF